MDDPIRALLVCGHPVIGGVVRLACDATGAIDVVGEVGSAASTSGAIDALAPSAVVIDLELPDADGLGLVAEASSSGRAVVVVSERADGPTVLGALRAGAGGYLVKPDGLRESGRVLLRVAEGERVLDPRLGEDLVREVGRVARQAREGARLAGEVTPREREILALLADGLTMRQVGRRLGISSRTVESHVLSLYRKLGVHSRVQAVAKGAALGLIDLG